MTFIYIMTSIFIIYYIILFIVYKKVFARNSKNSLSEIKFTKKQIENKKETSKKLKEYYKRENEEIIIKSHDNLNLYSKYYHQNDNGLIIIHFHGYKGNNQTDNSGIKKIAFENDINLLIPNQRAHSKSDGKSITYGIKERRDAFMWAYEISKRYPNNKIILSGVSLGGATVLMASSLPLPKNVIGIIADCPFNSPIGIIEKILKDKKYPVKLLSKFVCLSSLVFAKINLQSTDAIKSVLKTKLPILIIHSKDDRIVPYKMSEELKIKAKQKIELHSFTNADHALSFFEDPEKYEKIVLNFIKKVEQNENK